MPRERPIINWDEVPVIIDVPVCGTVACYESRLCYETCKR